MGTDLQTTNQNTGLSMNSDPEVIKLFRENLQNFTTIINKAPKKEKIQKHQGYEYLPISVVEKELARLFFGQVEYEVISYMQIFNEIACHARIRVLHPVTLQKMVFDGLGSSVIQQDSGTKVSDFMLYKKPNALQLALPKAYAEALKNASKKIGKAYGSDINRRFEDEYEPFIKEKKDPEKIHHNRLVTLISEAETLEQLANYKKDLPETLFDLYNERAREIQEKTK